MFEGLPRRRVVLRALLVALLLLSTVAYPLRGGAAAVTHVTVTPTTLSLLVGGTATVVATVHPAHAADRRVSWASNNPAVATVNNEGVVTGAAVGLAIITASTGDGGRTASVAVSVAAPPVRVTGVTLNHSSLRLTTGETRPLTATVVPADAGNRQVTWASSNAQVATVNVHGLVAGVAPGLAIVTATTGDGNFTAQTVVEVVAAVVPITGLTVTPSTLNLTIGATGALSAVVSPHNSTVRRVVWASRHPLVAQVSELGVVTAIAAGRAEVTATTLDGSHTVTVAVTVPVPAVAVTGVTITPASVDLTTGTTRTLTATVTPANATIRLLRWVTSNAAVANVSAAGIITAVAPGAAWVSATTLDGGFVATVAVSVTIPIVSVTGVIVAPSTLSLVVGQSGTIAATVAPANATNRLVTWSSGNTLVATVNDSGVVTARAPGSASITARTADGGRTATTAVTVTAPVVSVTGVTTSPATLSLTVGQSGTIAATVVPSNATNRLVTWASSDTRVAVVNTNGAVTAMAPGITVISVTTVDGGRTASAAVTVAAPAILATGVTMTPPLIHLTRGQVGALLATVLPENATNRFVTFTSSSPLVADIDGRGVVTALALGTAIITVTTSDGGHTAESVVVVAHPRLEVPIAPDTTTVVTLPEIADVVIPAGAISGVNARLIAEVVPTPETVPLLSAARRANLVPASEIVQLTLSGGTVNRAVHLAQRFTADKIITGQVAAVYVYNARTERWIYLGGESRDGVVMANVDGFGQFSVFSTRPAPVFSDVAQHWARGPISTLAGMHIVGGHRDGTYRPEAVISRAEFVAMLVRALTLPENTRAAERFADAATFSWAAGAIGASVQAGLVGGNADGSFAPERGITRAELAVIMARVVQQGLVTVPRVPAAVFADQHAIPAWAASGVRMAAEAGLVQGTGEGRFNPHNLATRAEVATMLYRLVAAR